MNYKSEIWKDIVGYEGLYKVSNYGRVKALERNRKYRTYPSIILKLRKDTHGYLQAFLYKNNVRKAYLVHRLVAQAFLKNGNIGQEINHIDEDKTNNKLTNLEWCNRNYNVNYGNRTLKTAKKINQYALNGKFIKQWNSLSDASRNLRISVSGISACCRNINKTCGGYIWRYEEVVDNGI